MKTLSITLIAVALLSMSCAQEREQRGQVRVGRGQNVAQPGGTTDTVRPGEAFTPAFAHLQDVRSDEVETLLSVSLDTKDPSQFKGPVESQDITFYGNMQLSGNQQNVLSLNNSTVQIVSGSWFNMYIYDGLAYSHDADPILIGFAPNGSNGYSVSGTVGGGHATVKFTDKYGDIILEGQYNRDSFSGNISFKNNAVNGSSATQGTLGSFYVSTCGFFHCQ